LSSAAGARVRSLTTPAPPPQRGPADIREIFGKIARSAPGGKGRSSEKTEAMLSVRDVVIAVRENPAARRLLAPAGAQGAPSQYIVGRMLQRLGKSKGDSISWTELEQCIRECSSERSASALSPTVGSILDWPDLGIGVSSEAQAGVCVQRIVRSSAATALRWRVGDRICAVQVGRGKPTPTRSCGDVAKWAHMRHESLPRVLTLFVMRSQPDDAAPALEHTIITPAGIRSFVVCPQPQNSLASPRRTPPQVVVSSRSPIRSPSANDKSRTGTAGRLNTQGSSPLSDPSDLTSGASPRLTPASPRLAPGAHRAGTREPSRSGSGPRIGSIGDAVVVNGDALAEEGAADPLELSEIVAGDNLNTSHTSFISSQPFGTDERRETPVKTPSPRRRTARPRNSSSSTPKVPRRAQGSHAALAEKEKRTAASCTQVPRDNFSSKGATANRETSCRRTGDVNSGHVPDGLCTCPECQAVWNLIEGLIGSEAGITSGGAEGGGVAEDQEPATTCTASSSTMTLEQSSMHGQAGVSHVRREESSSSMTRDLAMVMSTAAESVDVTGATPAHGTTGVSTPSVGLEGFPRLNSKTPDAASFIEGLWERYGSTLYESPARVSNASLPAVQP